jgi:hypothetical protein
LGPEIKPDKGKEERPGRFGKRVVTGVKTHIPV